MPATNPRISTVVEQDLHLWLQQRSQKEGRSVSVLVRDILRNFYENEEERFWAAEGEKRLETFDESTALSHDDAWS